jgi:hypothetical protein
VSDQDITTTAPAAPSAAAPDFDRSAYDAELTRLRNQVGQYEQSLSALQPYADEINWLASDPGNAEFIRKSRRAYEQARQEDTQLPPGMRALGDKVDKIDKFVDSLQAEQQRAAQEPFQRWMREAEAFLHSKAKDNPAIQEQLNNIAYQFGALSRPVANGGRGMSLDEAWQYITEPPYVKKNSPAPPPPSMRADAGMPGLPPPSRETPTASNGSKKLSQIILERLQPQGA